ncbi:MAG TPA: peptidase S8 [Microscillaceae bacterium]|nr:peptidase S8 [Microscillaceae bacterium]
MKHKITIACLLLLAMFVVVPASAQQKYSIKRTQKLQVLRKTYQNKYLNTRLRAYKRAKTEKMPVRLVEEDGSIIELQGYSKPQGGIPLYLATDNINAAKTIGTYNAQIQLGLNGSGITLGIWDGGGIRTTHQEFGNRAIQKDSAASLSSHATHVAGTMVAAGVNFGAKGMSPNATLHAYDWNDDLVEMTNESAQGLLISNHSYGFIHGWRFSSSTGWRWYGDTTVNDTIDYRFGFYGERSRDWDQLAYNAPYYLICRSAGNERNDNHTGEHQYYNGTAWVTSTTPRTPDGQYDCLGTDKVAKNILTIGAVEDITSGYTQPSDVVQTSFSSWGPTDDGRIKPDIVANGSSVYSTDDDSDTDYTVKSGTSMSTPSVSGSLGLLQQHYHKQNGRYMRAATLKALVIHTADEAGPTDGPDYQNGWGLMNTRTAADVINNNGQLAMIKEDSLVNGGYKILTVKATGKEPLVVSIVWTDIPGTPVAPALNPRDRMLVNDLDMRIKHWSGVYKPWKLDPANPSAAAFTGDNDVDNVEKIYIPNPRAGYYHIVIKHKNTLTGGGQAFSLIATGITQGSLFFPIPENLTANNLSTSTADLQWDRAGYHLGYDVRYRVQGSNEWKVIRKVRRPHLALRNLTQGTTYEFQVRSSIKRKRRKRHHFWWGNDFFDQFFSSAYSSLATFTTALPCVASFPYSESFENGFGQWTQATNDDSDWTHYSGSTPSSATGPAGAKDGTFYAYIEASVLGVGYPNKTAVLQSPCFDVSALNQASFKFSYHMYNESNQGSIALEASNDNGATWQPVWSPADSVQQDQWLDVEVDLANLLGGSLQLRFTGTTGESFRPDIAIDNISLTTDQDSQRRNKVEAASQVNLDAVTISPNPAHSQVTVTTDAQNNDLVNFSLINLNGTILKSTPIRSKSTIATQTFDVRRYPKGVYFIKVETKKGVVVKRVVIN